MEGRFECTNIEVERYSFDKLRGKIKDCKFVEEAVDPFSVGDFSHTRKTALLSNSRQISRSLFQRVG